MVWNTGILVLDILNVKFPRDKEAEVSGKPKDLGFLAGVHCGSPGWRYKSGSHPLEVGFKVLRWAEPTRKVRVAENQTLDAPG